jgi:hypothetical protein
MLKKSTEVFLFTIGFIFGVLINLSYKFSYDKSFTIKKTNLRNEILSSTEFYEYKRQNKFDALIADKLFDEIKIVCLVLTQPTDHQTKAKNVKNTWGSKCNKLIFLSTENDNELGAIGLPFNESREILWGKVKEGFLYAYENFYEDADWFLKADDDS